MKRKRYEIKIKMIKETTMSHEQESMGKALNDVKNVLKNSSNDSLNKIFNSEPKFTYRIEIQKNGK